LSTHAPADASASSAIRPVTDADAAALIELVGAAYADHPGCVMDLPGVDADLRAPATAAARRGGRWWVLEADGRVVASIGTGPVLADGQLELKRLYLDRAARGRGIASALVRRVEAHAVGLGAVAVELWSDTRFEAAHHRYRRLGYRATGEQRELHDPSDTTEHRFVKTQRPSAPQRELVWQGPYGEDACELVALPDGTLLRGEVGGARYEVEVDASWRTRRAELATATAQLRLTSDGAGRWWREGRPVEYLTGCLDVDLEMTPATNLLPVRRLAIGVGEADRTTAALLRADGVTVERREQRYERTGAASWRYASGSFEATIEVDDDGLPVRYVTRDGDELWTRVR
jgi:GNAT superfamily N-acetyltransferase